MTTTPEKLRAWLDKIEATHVKTLSTKPFGFDVWKTRKGVLFLTLCHENGGWDVYTALDALDIEQTFTDAEERINTL